MSWIGFLKQMVFSCRRKGVATGFEVNLPVATICYKNCGRTGNLVKIAYLGKFQFLEKKDVVGTTTFFETYHKASNREVVIWQFGIHGMDVGKSALAV